MSRKVRLWGRGINVEPDEGGDESLAVRFGRSGRLEEGCVRIVSCEKAISAINPLRQ